MATLERRLVSAEELRQMKAFTPQSEKSKHSKFETLLNALALGAHVYADIAVIADTLKAMDAARKKELAAMAPSDQQELTGA